MTLAAAPTDAQKTSLCAGLAEAAGLDASTCAIGGDSRRRRRRMQAVTYSLTATEDISSTLADTDLSAAASTSSGLSVTVEDPEFETEVDYTIVQTMDGDGDPAASMDDLAAALSDPTALSDSIAAAGGAVLAWLSPTWSNGDVETVVIDNPLPEEVKASFDCFVIDMSLFVLVLCALCRRTRKIPKCTRKCRHGR